jgi:PII-like signaling protein
VTDPGCLKLTTFFGEHDRAGGGFLADRLCDIYQHHRVRASTLVRGTDGFGIHHRLQTTRLLTMSEDLPLVSVAIDRHERIEAVLGDVRAASSHGLITLERTRVLTPHTTLPQLPADLERQPTKLTIYCGRGERVGTTPADVALVDLLYRNGISGATVLLGVDGTINGRRMRARFLGRNRSVPLMVLAVGEGRRIAAVAQELATCLPPATVTLERVQTLKRDGNYLSPFPTLISTDASGLNLWQKLIVYSSEQARYRNRPLHTELLRRLRTAGAAGATVLRGVRGYHGRARPHGESMLSLRRQGPVITVLVDSPHRMRRWLEIVDELTQTTGLVTSEVIPALQATGPKISEGGLRLARTQAAPA